jgi:UDP-N-acetylglucosamine 2-epimerase (non-hydrolysing)
MMARLNPEHIMQCYVQLELQATCLRTHESSIINYRMVADYSIPNLRDKVVKTILYYTDYNNRTARSK